MYVELEPAHQRQNIFTRIASWNVLALMTETCAETILRQRWSAEKLLLNGCLQCYNTWLWQMTHMLRLCGKSDAKKLQLVFWSGDLPRPKGLGRFVHDPCLTPFDLT
jgi:hypothetical protein